MKISIAGVISLLLVAVVAVMLANGMESSGLDAAQKMGVAGATGATEPDIESRVQALESALVVEQNARQLLEEELFFLMDEFIPSREAAAKEIQQAETDARNRDAAARQRISRRANGNSLDGRRQRLVAAGFDAAKADWILARESELQMENLRRRYAARRDGSTLDFSQQSFGQRDQLRQELGDAEYEQYLTAYGRPVDVPVAVVLDNSPAQSAGMRAGDRIVSYGGERVYGIRDLTQMIMRDGQGERVVVDFLRDDIPMQVVLPRGPLGIEGGR